MQDETREQLVERRYEQIRQGATEAIRREVEWLRRHRFAVWVCDENGVIVDATDRSAPERTDQN